MGISFVWIGVGGSALGAGHGHQGPPDPDLCGTWKMVELTATVVPHAGDEASDRKTFCEPIPVLVPAVLEAAGGARGASATLTFVRYESSGHATSIDCKYRGREHGGVPSYELNNCNHGVHAGQSVTAQTFELELKRNHAHAGTTARVQLSDGTPPPAGAYRELLGTTPNLAGVTLRVPAAGLAPFAGVELQDGPPFAPRAFVANLPFGVFVAGPSVEITGPSALPSGTSLTVPFDRALVDSLPAGSRSTLEVQRIIEELGPGEFIASNPTETATVSDFAGAMIVGLASPGLYLTTIRDLTPISYHGGALMDQGVNVYLIWVGDFSANAAEDPRPAIRDFIRDLPGSPWYEIQATYAIGNRAVNLAGEIQRPGITGFTARADGAFSVYRDAIEPALMDGSLPLDTNGIYLVLAAPGVEEEGPNGQYCQGYCGYHTSARRQSTDVKWAFVGHPATCSAPWICGGPRSPTPHGLNVDGMISIVAHEIVEAVTNPVGGGWHGTTDLGYAPNVENADKCAWIFTSLEGAGTVASPYFNLTANGRAYLVQSNWVNAEDGYCGMGIESVAIEAVPQFDGLAMNAIGHFTVRITNTGPVRLDQNQLVVIGNAAGPLATDPLPVRIPGPIDPGGSSVVDVPVQAPYEISGNIENVPFTFRVRDPQNAHTFGARATVIVAVRRAEILLDQSECVALEMPAEVDENTWFLSTARLRNTGTTQWTAGEYQLVALPLDLTMPNIQLPQLLFTTVPPGGEAVVPFYAYAPFGQRGQSFSIGVAMANPAGAFQVGCGNTTQVRCDGGAGAACGSCGGIVQCDGSCSVGTPGNLGQPCGSCAGAVQCDGSCSVPTPPNLGDSCSACGGTVQCGGTCSAPCHSVVFRMANIDDEAFLWLGGPGDTADAICEAHLSQGGAGSCDLTALMESRGGDLSNVTFTLKLGNGGGFNTNGEFYLSIDGNEQELSRQLSVIAHTGWVHRQRFTVDFVGGTVSPAPADSCVTIFDCID